MTSARAPRPVIRAAGPDDLPAVLALWRTADATPTHTDDLVALETLRDRDPAALLVGVIDGALVGSVIAAWDGWRGSVYRLAVSPDHRRRGLARALVTAAEARLAALGARRLQAVVVETDVDAVAFWGTSGWERQQARLRFVSG